MFPPSSTSAAVQEHLSKFRAVWLYSAVEQVSFPAVPADSTNPLLRWEVTFSQPGAKTAVKAQ